MARKPALPGVDRRQQLLEAALEVFAEQGFEAATNKAIAERAGVNQGLIYFYFASKADVYFATFAHFTDLVMAQIDAVFAQEDDANAADDLARRLRRLLRILSSPPAIHLLRFIYQAISGRAPTGELSSNEGRKVVITLMRHLSQRLRQYLETRMARGEFATLEAGMVANLMTRTLIITIAGGRGQGGNLVPDLDQLADTMAALYCYGLIPREGNASVLMSLDDRTGSSSP